MPMILPLFRPSAAVPFKLRAMSALSLSLAKFRFAFVAMIPYRFFSDDTDDNSLFASTLLSLVSTVYFIGVLRASTITVPLVVPPYASAVIGASLITPLSMVTFECTLFSTSLSLMMVPMLTVPVPLVREDRKSVV